MTVGELKSLIVGPGDETIMIKFLSITVIILSQDSYVTCIETREDVFLLLVVLPTAVWHKQKQTKKQCIYDSFDKNVNSSVFLCH